LKGKFRSVFVAIANLDIIIAGFFTAVVVLLTIFMVIMRYAINQPVSWGEEIVLSMFLWIIFLGTSAAFRKGDHIVVEFLIDRLPVRIRRIAELLINIITLALLFYLMLQGFEYLKLLVASHRVTAQLRIPYPVIYAIMPVSCILMMLNLIYATIVKFTAKPAECSDKEVTTDDL